MIPKMLEDEMSEADFNETVEKLSNCSTRNPIYNNSGKKGGVTYDDDLFFEVNQAREQSA